ncbi:hypothetical protein E1294_09830 [Nonomuraea diastatica]|uniref:Sulfatase N-terminal domain-containing protein n=1 Tax=Nonomuraea diastatica TaxID=1848329 RepID=A0A4R4WZ17_9ACTN|nr:hypothetical protein E1294_09830 [Nonomuraea diastatica]
MNVLILMSDEQSWSTLGCNGNPAARTPHLDRLAGDSTALDACYTPFPLCCPSRASLWTGLMPRHHHVLGNWRAIDPALRDSSVASAFADAGYHTMYTGKWHVPGTTPERMGFADTSAIPSTIKGRQRGRHIPEYCDYLEGHGYHLYPGDVQNLTAADREALRDPAAPLRATSQSPLEHSGDLADRAVPAYVRRTARGGPVARRVLLQRAALPDGGARAVRPAHRPRPRRAARRARPRHGRAAPRGARVQVRRGVRRARRGRLARDHRPLPRAVRAHGHPGRADPRPPARRR